MWRTGVVLHKSNIFNALARVRWDKEDQKILLHVCGEEWRRSLSFIRETVKEIVGDFTNLNFNELVPIPGSKEFLECLKELRSALVPVILRKTDWQDLPLAEIQCTPGEWNTSAKNKDEAWTKVSESLRPVLEKAKQRKKVLLEKRRGM